MPSIDLFKHYPSARLGTAEADPAELRAARSTTLDIQPSTRRRKADPNRVAQILSRLITLIQGRPLTDWFPVAEGVPAIIGVEIDENMFDEFERRLEHDGAEGHPAQRVDVRRVRRAHAGRRHRAHLG